MTSETEDPNDSFVKLLCAMHGDPEAFISITAALLAGEFQCDVVEMRQQLLIAAREISDDEELDARCRDRLCEGAGSYVIDEARCLNCGWKGPIRVTLGHKTVGETYRCKVCDCKEVRAHGTRAL